LKNQQTTLRSHVGHDADSALTGHTVIVAPTSAFTRVLTASTAPLRALGEIAAQLAALDNTLASALPREALAPGRVRGRIDASGVDRPQREMR